MSKCSDVMTRDPACCEPGDGITRVAEIMKRHDVGSVPVVDSHEDKKLIGIVTDRDIVVKVVAGGSNVERATVREAMTPHPASVRESDDVDRAVQLMSERQVRRMPVVDSGGHLCGIIAQADVATRVATDQKTGEMVEAISEPRVTRR